MATTTMSSLIRMVQKLGHHIKSFADPSGAHLQYDLEKLQVLLMGIQAVLIDAEEKEWRDQQVKSWLNDLKAASFDAEDKLDEFEFVLHTNPSSRGEEVYNSVTSLACNIRSIRERFDEISLQKEILCLKDTGFGRSWAESSIHLPLETDANESCLFVREEVKNDIIEMLLSGKPEKPSVIPIVGIAGVGKTTLAQFVYSDPRISNHFETRGWVCMSEEVDAVGLARNILESITFETWGLSDLSHFISSLKCRLRGMKFLLVLDDFCYENQSSWESVCISLMIGQLGSSVLLTTRDEQVARYMQTMPCYPLQRLSEANSWLLFQHHAFGSQELSTQHSYVTIGRKLVENCQGLPLSIKMLGSALRHERDESKWNDILKSDIWDFDGRNSGTLSVLILSYFCLPPPLQSCFAYCSLFPKGYKFKKDRLVRLWIAEGFISPVEGKVLEVIGCNYFDELLRRSFFHCYHAGKQKFVMFAMHHLLHDLARSISATICRTDDGDLSFSKETRHSSIVPKHCRGIIKLESCMEPRALHTLLVMNTLINQSIQHYSYTPDSDLLPISLLGSVLQKLKFLRTLDLSYTNLEDLPDSIIVLRHLNFLGLNRTQIKVLPESLCSLYNLQSLELEYCYNLRELPEGLPCLSNLRHLLLPSLVNPVHVPCGIKKLTNLHTLPVFHIGRQCEHCVIRELEYLVNLQGELCISGLCNVVNTDDAKAANLMSKEHLEKLTLDWSGSYSVTSGVSLEQVLSEQERPGLGAALHTVGLEDNVDEENVLTQNSLDEAESQDDDQWIFRINVVYKPVDLKKAKKEVVRRLRQLMEFQEDVFESLHPHANLKELIIQSYSGNRFPKWIGDKYFSKLVSITFSGCNIEILPPLGQLPSLRYVHIDTMYNLKHVGREFHGHGNKTFPALETLEIERMYKWEEWCGVEDGDFPRLRRLKISDCWNLRTLPGLSFLEELELNACYHLTSLPILPLLMKLHISNIQVEILSLLCQDLSRLQTLMVCYMQILTSLSLQHLHSLRKLCILSCHQKVDHLAQQQQSTTCEQKKIESHEYNCFCAYIELPPKLQVLNIKRCNNMCFLPDECLPSTLQVLNIYDCPLLAQWCHQHENKLADVSQVTINHRESD